MGLSCTMKIIADIIYRNDNIWRSSITLETKLRLYNTCILPIFLYGAATLSVTVIYQRRSTHWTIGASDGFSMSIGQNSSPMMRYALVPGSHFCPTLFAVVVCPSLAICTAQTPHKTITVLYRLAFWVLLMIGEWRRRIGRPRQSWLRTVEADLRPMNLVLATSKRRAQDRSAWRKLVTTATSTTSS